MADEDRWIAPTRGLIRMEMIKREWGYADLAKALTDTGVEGGHGGGEDHYRH